VVGSNVQTDPSALAVLQEGPWRFVTLRRTDGSALSAQCDVVNRWKNQAGLVAHRRIDGSELSAKCDVVDRWKNQANLVAWRQTRGSVLSARCSVVD
jgi:hypothetical protein